MDPFPEDWQRALAVVAHPDDLEYGVASAVARWSAQGKAVSYLLATRGEAGIDTMPPEQAAPVREAEERRAAAAVGVSHVEFLNHADGLLEHGVVLRRDIAAAIRRLRPDVVITLHFELTWGASAGVNHADHRAVGLAVLDACRDAANRWLFPELGEPWSGVEGVYVAATEPSTHYVDVTETIDAGIASLREHELYMGALGGDFDPDAFLRQSAQQAGRAAGCPLAVPFRRYSV